MSSEFSLSIAMATYNGARFIEEQLKSIAAQTILPDELVVTDDVSSDETLDIVRAFAVNAPFPVHIEKNPERLGYRANFLKAANLCHSEIIAFCDQDDVWLPQKLSVCRPLFEDHELLLVYHNALIVTESLKPIATLQERAAPRIVNPPFSTNPWQHGLGFTQLFRRSLLTFSEYWPQSVDFFNSKQREAHDQWVSFLSSCLGSIYYIDEPLALYRQHEGNTFGWNKKEQTIKGQFANLLSSTLSGLEQYELSAKQRASILMQIGTTLGGLSHKRTTEGTARFQDMQRLYSKRQRIYQSPYFLIRLYRFVGVLLEGFYRPRKDWGVGFRAMMRDLVRGVFLPTKSKTRA